MGLSVKALSQWSRERENAEEEVEGRWIKEWEVRRQWRRTHRSRAVDSGKEKK
jgi:hypothetical protein